MTVRQFINSFLGDFKAITILDYIGDFSAIGADLEEDYEKNGSYSDMRSIPASVIERKMEYFTIEDGEIIIYLMAK